MVHKLIKYSPIIWITGLSIGLYQIVLGWYYLSRRRSQIRHTKYSIALSAFILSYIFSLLLATIRGVEASRVFAGFFFNISYWIIGLIVIITKDQIEIKDIQVESRRVLLFMLSFACIVLIVPDIFGGRTITTLMGIIIPAGISKGVDLHLHAPLFSNDVWEGGYNIGLRPGIMSPYAVAFAYTIFILVALSVPGKKWVDKILYKIILVPGAFLMVTFASTSRGVAVAFIIFATMNTIGGIFSRIKSEVGFKYGIIILAVVPVALAVGVYGPVVLEKINSARVDSSAVRIFIYQYSIDQVMTSHYVFGFGTNEKIPNMEVYAGSHSTFVGALYKTGVVGTAFLVLFFLSLLWSSVKLVFHQNSTAYDRRVGSAVIAFFSILAVEEIDAGPFQILLFFTLAAIVFARAEGLRTIAPIASHSKRADA